jgi:quercetin dioxygenase-like cupin family protein
MTAVELRLDEGEVVTSQNRRDILILAERPELTITWSRYAPRERGPDLHIHYEHVDAFYVLEGELTFLVGPEAQPTVVGAGGFVAVPPNVVHTFVNDGNADAKWLNLHAPDAGFAVYLRGLYGGPGGPFDTFAPPSGGGLPAGHAIVAKPGEGVKADLPGLYVAEWADAKSPTRPPVGVAYRYTRPSTEGTRVIDIRG